MATATPQRAWRAACPNCGAPVEFRSAASASAVCGYCRSTLVRDGDALRRIGVSAELFDDHSPLRLGASGRWQGVGFTLVGRLQFAYDAGGWSEWHALFDNGRSGWLSEDNGACVLAFDAPLPPDAPAVDTLRPGEPCSVGGQRWQVASLQRVRLAAAEGELPAPPRLGAEGWVADLRNTRGEVATLDALDPARPLWSVGRAAPLDGLAMQGLADGPTEKTLRGSRSFDCPSCGAPLSPKLASTQSLVCPQCHAVVDLSAGVGGELAHYRQAAGPHDGDDGDDGTTRIPLGATGTMAFGGGPALPWQVVGVVERAELPDDPEDEQAFWREYLLYHREAGFVFLVDADDGWSWARPITGVPEPAAARMRLDGVLYEPLYRYTGTVTWVLGEFYWRLARDERTRNTDYRGVGADARKRLNREAAGQEVTWSAGEVLEAAAVAKAFGLPDGRLGALQRDSAPLAGGGRASSGGFLKPLLIFGLLVLLILLVSRCGADDCDDVRQAFGESSSEYRQCARGGGSGGFRTGGGSFGGFSSGGGGHK